MSDSGSGSDDDEKTESVGKMKQRHKRETKELEAKIKELSHGQNKKDKKDKAELQAKAKKLEDDLKARHAAELAAAESAIQHGQIIGAMAEMKLKQVRVVCNRNQNVTLLCNSSNHTWFCWHGQYFSHRM